MYIIRNLTFVNVYLDLNFRTQFRVQKMLTVRSAVTHIQLDIGMQYACRKTKWVLAVQFVQQRIILYRYSFILFQDGRWDDKKWQSWSQSGHIPTLFFIHMRYCYIVVTNKLSIDVHLKVSYTLDRGRSEKVLFYNCNYKKIYKMYTYVKRNIKYCVLTINNQSYILIIILISDKKITQN